MKAKYPKLKEPKMKKPKKMKKIGKRPSKSQKSMGGMF